MSAVVAQPLGEWGRGRAVLVCLPHAGGGVSTFRRWPPSLQPDVDVITVELPGRDRLVSEPAIDDLAKLVEQIDWALRPRLDRPVAVFGHSLGALVGYELIRRWERSGGPDPLLLFAAGRAAPQVPDRCPPMHELDDSQFIAELVRLQGSPAGVLDHPELMELLLPAIRADFRIDAEYVFGGDARVRTPIVALAGEQDDIVASDDVAAWQERTSGHAEFLTFAGGHFFVDECFDDVVSLVGRRLVDRSA